MYTEPLSQHEILTWSDVDTAIEHLLPQFNHEYDGLVMITRGGLFPGGILCEAMGIKNVHTAAVSVAIGANDTMAWPTFMQFPIDAMVSGKRLLVVDDIWANGINMVAVRGRLEAAGAKVETAVLHFRPKANFFPNTGPDYYGAITDRFIVYPWNTPAQFAPGHTPPSPPPPAHLG